MNKTISINLGGIFFHIDENAYQKLSRYFDAVKRSLSPDGKDEIIKDIESRIAELFQEKIKSTTQVITLKEIDEVITVMGQPEDYMIDEENNSSYNKESYISNSSTKGKKLYRDTEKATLGGICSGLEHYTGIDAIWIKILFIILTISGGFGIPIYLLLWILVPKAETTSQKLEMTGEPINISNIEKKVKEGYEEITGKLGNIDHQKIADNAKYGAEKVASSVGNIFLQLFNVFGKVIAIFILITAGITLVGVISAAVFMIFSASMPDSVVFNYIHTPLYNSVPYWIQGILFLLSVGIPLFFMVILGLKLLINNMKSIGSYAKYSLLALWLLSVICLIFIGIKQVTETGFKGKKDVKEQMMMLPTDTLYINMKYNDYYTKNVNRRRSSEFMHDENNNEVIYSNNVFIHLMTTNEKVPFVQVEKTAEGKSYNDAKNRAEKINYNFKIENNKLDLDNYFTTDFKNQFRDQEVHIFVYLPENTIVFPDESINKFLSENNSTISKYYGDEGYFYVVKNKELNCLNCPIDEEEDGNFNIKKIKINDNIISLDTIENNFSIKVNEKELKINVKDDELNIKTK